MGKKHKRIKRETLISYLMIAPEMILMLIFIFIPIVVMNFVFIKMDIHWICLLISHWIRIRIN